MLIPGQIVMLESAIELLQAAGWSTTASDLRELKDQLVRQTKLAKAVTLQDVLAEFDRLSPPSKSRYRSIDLEVNGHGTAAWMADWGWYARAEGEDEPVSGGDFHNLADLLSDMRAKLGKPVSSAPSSVEEVSQQVVGLEPGSLAAGGAK